MTADQIWQAVLSELQLQMTKATFDTWVKNTSVLNYTGDVLVIGTQDASSKEWLENRLLPTVERTLVGIVGRPVEVNFVVKQEREPRPEISGPFETPVEGLVPAADSPPTAERRLELGLQPVYLSARSAITQPDKGIFVTMYSLLKWLPLLGHQRWGLVQVLRGLCTHLPYQPNGTKQLQTTWQELGEVIGVDPDTIGRWLKHEPIPGDKLWRRLVAGSEAEPNYLRLFIPRLRYVSKRVGGTTKRVGFLLEILMEDPLTPADERRLQALPNASVNPQDVVLQSTANPQSVGLLSGANLQNMGSQSDANPQNPGLHPGANPQSVGSQSHKPTNCGYNVNELTRYIENKVNTRLTGRRQIRRELKPVVAMTEDILGDYHSTAMLYKVLLTLYPDHLRLFTEAVGEAVAIGQEDLEANLGAVFVATLKELAAGTGVELGLGGA